MALVIPRKPRKKPNNQVQVVPDGNKSVIAAVALAPILVPMISSAVSEVIRAIRGTGSPSQPGGSLRIAQQKRSTRNDAVQPQRQTPGSNATPGARVGVMTGRSGARNMVRATFADEVGTVTLPATAGSWGNALVTALTGTFVNPGNNGMHLVSYTEGYNWQNFTVNGVRLKFIPSAGDTQAGVAVMGYSDQPQPTPAADMISNESRATSLAPNAKQFSVNAPAFLTVPRQKSWAQERSIGSAAITDILDVAPGLIFCYATGIAVAAVTVGRLFIEIDYTLYDKRPYYSGAGLMVASRDLALRATKEAHRSRARALALECIESFLKDMHSLLNRVDPVETITSTEDFRAGVVAALTAFTRKPKAYDC